MEEAGHHVVGDRDRAQRGVHGPALERCAGRSPEQQFSGACEGGRVDVIAEDPPQRLHTARLTSGDRRFGRGGAPDLRDVPSHLAGSEVVEERVHHLPAPQLAAVIDGMRDRGLIGDDGWLSELGRAVKQRVEALTDDLAAKPYESLEPDELDELVTTLEPLATLLLAAQDW